MGSQGRLGVTRRPAAKSKKSVPMKAAMLGRRAANSLWPNTAKLVARAQ